MLSSLCAFLFFCFLIKGKDWTKWCIWCFTMSSHSIIKCWARLALMNFTLCNFVFDKIWINSSVFPLFRLNWQTNTQCELVYIEIHQKYKIKCRSKNEKHEFFFFSLFFTFIAPVACSRMTAKVEWEIEYVKLTMYGWFCKRNRFFYVVFVWGMLCSCSIFFYG